jgi:hypothetical protein
MSGAAPGNAAPCTPRHDKASIWPGMPVQCIAHTQTGAGTRALRASEPSLYLLWNSGLIISGFRPRGSRPALRVEP